MDRLWTSVEALFMTVLENPGLIPQISTELKTVCVPSCEEDPDRSTQIIARVENNQIFDSTKGKLFKKYTRKSMENKFSL